MAIRRKIYRDFKGKIAAPENISLGLLSLTSDCNYTLLTSVDLSHDMINDGQRDKFFHSVNKENMWSLLTQSWNPSSTYEITSTVNNRISKRTAKIAKKTKTYSRFTHNVK